MHAYAVWLCTIVTRVATLVITVKGRVPFKDRRKAKVEGNEKPLRQTGKRVGVRRMLKVQSGSLIKRFSRP